MLVKDLPEYNSWRAMRKRCYKTYSTNYRFYGAKGIRVCERWIGKDGFRNFYQDMGLRPLNHTLDRLDSKGDYTPENCRWATHEQQANNRADNIRLTYKGRTLTLSQWSRELGIALNTIQQRTNKSSNPFFILRPVEKSKPRFCTWEGCIRKHYGKGYCKMHYKRMFRYRVKGKEIYA